MEVKGRVNLDKLTAFLEELRVSRSRTVSLGTLMCARDASAADTTHIVEVRCCDCCSQPKTDRSSAFSVLYIPLLVGNHLLPGLDHCIAVCYPSIACCIPSACCLCCTAEHASCYNKSANAVVCLPMSVSYFVCSQYQCSSRYTLPIVCNCLIAPQRYGSWPAGKSVRTLDDGKGSATYAHPQYRIRKIAFWRILTGYLNQNGYRPYCAAIRIKNQEDAQNICR